MSDNQQQDKLYIHTTEDHNTRAAEQVVPIIMDLVHPESVIDVGCGIGTWLKVFNDCGVKNILGLDGDYVDRSMLHIPDASFKTADLSKKLNHSGKYDLVVSLEVAEHLPPSSAEVFVSSLVSLGDVILFAAAIPGQGGQNHLNEQWPQYWEQLFNKHGYLFHDVIRPVIWLNEKVDYWYRQNTFLVVRKSSALNNSLIRNTPILSAVHPYLWQFMLKVKNRHIASLERQLDDHQSGKIGISLSLQIFRKAFFRKLKK